MQTEPQPTPAPLITLHRPTLGTGGVSVLGERFLKLTAGGEERSRDRHLTCPPELIRCSLLRTRSRRTRCLEDSGMAFGPSGIYVGCGGIVATFLRGSSKIILV